MAALEGHSPSHKRESRPTLFLGWKRRPDFVHCGEQDHHSEIRSEMQPQATAIERFEAALWADRNRWSIERYRSGAVPGRLRKNDADRALRTALAAAFSGEAA